MSYPEPDAELPAPPTPLSFVSPPPFALGDQAKFTDKPSGNMSADTPKSRLGEPLTPATFTIPVPNEVPVVSSHAVGIISSIRSNPPPLWSIVSVPKVGIVNAI